MKVSRVCSRVELAGAERAEREGDAVLHCVLRGTHGANSSDTPEDSVFFEVVPDSGELARILVRQANKVEVEFRFANWRFDPPLSATMFHFEVPRGVAIVNGDPTTGEFGAQ